MRNLKRKSIVLALFAASCFSCSVTIFAQASGTSGQSVTGKVTMDGRGLFGITLVAWKQPYMNPGGDSSYVAKTNLEGKYQLKLPPGAYFVSVTTTTVYEVENGKPSYQLRALTVVAGESPADFDFEVGKGGVVTGRITDADNNPAIEVDVVLTLSERRDAALSQKLPMGPGSRVQTDDRGVYRLFGVAPGRYRLEVGKAITAYTSRGGRPAFKRMFYPGTPDETKATILEVTAGKELTGINLKLAAVEGTFVVKGLVIDDETGQPIPNINCGLDVLVGGQLSGALSGINLTNKNGECTIENVPAGHYRISVPSSLSFGSSSKPNYYGLSANFEVIDHDISGISVKAARGLSVSGKVVIDGSPDQKLLALLQTKQFIVSSIPTEAGHKISACSVTINADGSFYAEGLSPGRLNVGMTEPSEGFPFLLLRTELQGVEQKDPIQLKAGDQVSNLRLVLVHATGGLHGTAKLSRGPFPSDLKGTAALYRDGKHFVWSLVDSRGQFMFGRVPPGNYQLIVSVGNEGPPRMTARTEQMVEIGSDKVSEVIVVLEPKVTP